MDGQNTTILHSYEEINQTIDSDGWSPYIMLMCRKQSHQDLDFINESIARASSNLSLPIRLPEVIQIGGTFDHPQQ